MKKCVNPTTKGITYMLQGKKQFHFGALPGFFTNLGIIGFLKGQLVDTFMLVERERRQGIIYFLHMPEEVLGFVCFLIFLPSKNKMLIQT